MQNWIALVVSGVLALAALALAVALVRSRSRTERDLAAARSETAALRDQLDDLSRRIDRPQESRTPIDAEFVITDLGLSDPDPEQSVPEVSTVLFADLVLRETVVKAASLAHGVRRALDAETRNRIRFEMRREVKRARKQRRSDTRQARREWEARRRAGVDEEGTAA